MVLVSCRQANAKVKQLSKGIDLEFDGRPLDVSQEVADYLLKINPDMFCLSDKPKKRSE